MTPSRPRFAAAIAAKLPGTANSVQDPFVRKTQAAGSKIQLLPSQWVEKFVRIKNGDTGTVDPMDFSERRYLLRPYNTPNRKILLFTARQCEKCVATTSMISLQNGRLVEAGSIRVGDLVATLRPDGSMSSSRVTWVSRQYPKPVLQLTTRQGHVLDAATTHPLRVWDAWKPAGKLRVGDRIAAVRQCGVFAGTATPPAERIRLTAYLIGDGSIGSTTVGFTAVPGPVLDDFLRDVTTLGGTWRRYQKKDNRAVDIRLRWLPVLKEWLSEDGLSGHRSGTKFLPSWVFDLSKRDTALFLNRLWSTDGHVSQRAAAQYHIVYCSMSKLLVEQVQALLWKFGIPSRIRTNWPSIYKRRGEKKLAYLLHVETKDGITTFLTSVGALGKSEKIPLPPRDSNNNLDTFPAEIQDLLSRIMASRTGRRSELFAAGLPRTLEYAPTLGKLERYVEAFRADERYDQSLVNELEGHVYSDVYWDRIRTIKKLGDQTCVDFEVEDTHNFVAAGLITHNSTTIGNKLMSISALRSIYTSLFVSPSAMQTKVFSTARIDDIIEVSPLVKGLTHNSLRMNILEKEFINKSKIYLRYAFLTADRIRGLSVNAIFIDEIQDLMQDLLPVIEETASHHKESLFCYSGTPKSFDNTIETYWNKHSTQSEWVIPCERHGTPKDAKSWHWVVLGPKNLGKTGPICEKCGGPLNPEHPMAQWVEMNPGAQIEGLRVCRLMVPWFAKDPKKWKEILQALERYPTAQFMNEVMALSYDSGSKPLTRLELMQACDDKYRLDDEDGVAKMAESYQLYAGMDWGGGSDGQGAFTVMFIGGYVRGDARFQYVYCKRFSGPEGESDVMMREVLRLLKRFRITKIGSDFGMGFFPNKELSNVFGPAKVLVFQYVGRMAAKLTYKPQSHRFMAFRSLVMADLFMAIKKCKVAFPGYEQFKEPFGTDMLSIRSEYNESLKVTQYIKTPGIPDDSFHAALYCLLASMTDHRRPDIMFPLRENSPDAALNMAEDQIREELEAWPNPSDDPGFERF